MKMEVYNLTDNNFTAIGSLLGSFESKEAAGAFAAKEAGNWYYGVAIVDVAAQTVDCGCDEDGQPAIYPLNRFSRETDTSVER